MSTLPTPAETPELPATDDERRQRHRLRELCDEVLASRRADAERDVITPEERREARSLLARFAPRAGLRERPR